MMKEDQPQINLKGSRFFAVSGVFFGFPKTTMVGSRRSHRDESVISQSDLSFRIYEIYMSLNCVHTGGDGDAVSLFMFYFYTPED